MSELVGHREKLIIPCPSPELRVKAIETLPVPIKFGEVIFNPRGIYRYGGNDRDESARDEYYRRCREGGIIPNSTLTFGTSYEDEQSFCARRDAVEIELGNINDDRAVKDTKREATLQGLIKGGKFAVIIYNITTFAFSNFRQVLLPPTLAQGYEMNSATLVLTSYRLTGYNEGVYSDITLHINSREIRVAGGEWFDKYDALKAWFEELKGQQKLPQL